MRYRGKRGNDPQKLITTQGEEAVALPVVSSMGEHPDLTKTRPSGRQGTAGKLAEKGQGKRRNSRYYEGGERSKSPKIPPAKKTY